MMLAQLLGTYLIIVGAIVMYRRRSLMPAVTQMVANRPILLVLGLVELVAGLAIVLVYPALSLDAAGLISLIGWMMIVESILYLTLPHHKVQRFVRKFNTAYWYQVGGVVAILMGIYLVRVGFGLM